MRRAPPSRAEVLAAMRSLAVDGVTAEVVPALESSGVEVVLLKGPVIARWLYPDGGRDYGDTDLLVSARDERRAEAVLTRLGFRADRGTGRADPGIARNHMWVRGPAIVELHVTLTGIGAAPEQVWTILADEVETMELRGRTVRVLGPAARLLHVALHAAQHGPAFGKALRDLELACAAHGVDDWRAAAALAARLDAVDALSAGLGLVAAGVALKRELRLPDASDPMVLLRAASASPVAMGLARFAGAPLRGRVEQLLRVVLPTPTFLRWWTPVASRGRVGLLAAYVWRYAYLVGALPEAIRTFKATRRPRAVPPR